MSFDPASMFSFLSGDTSDLIAFVQKYDPEKRARRALDGLNTVHIRVALNIIFVEAMTQFLGDACKRLKHTVYLRKMYERSLKTKQETGAELLSSTFSMKVTDVSSFFDQKAPSSQGPNGPVEDTESEDDWLVIPDPAADDLLKATDPERFALKLKQRQLKMEQMELRYKKCRAWVMCFWEEVKAPEIQKLIRDRNEELFLKEEYYGKINWFKDDKWIFGLEGKDANGVPIEAKDANGKKLNSDAYPRSTAEAWEEIVITDQFEQEAVEKKRKKTGEYIADPKPLQTEVWYRLNNALLLAEVEATIDNESIDKLLQFIRDLYDDVESGKVAQISNIPTLIIEKIQTTMPSLNMNSSMRLFDFILEAVFQNVKQFREAFKAAQNIIPKGLLNLAKNYGYDFENVDVDKFVETQVSQLAQVRNNRQQLIANDQTVTAAIRDNNAPPLVPTVPLGPTDIGQLASNLYKNLIKPPE
jgi:hypothetical protein